MIQEKILTKYNVYHATKHVQSDDDRHTERWEKYHLSTDTINIFGVKRFSLTLVGYGLVYDILKIYKTYENVYQYPNL